MPREEIFHKFKEGTLKSGSGAKVKSRKQAIAIAMQYDSAKKGLSSMPMPMHKKKKMMDEKDKGANKHKPEMSENDMADEKMMMSKKEMSGMMKKNH